MVSELPKAFKFSEGWIKLELDSLALLLSHHFTEICAIFPYSWDGQVGFIQNLVT